MKQGAILNRILMILLFLALAIYLGVYAYRSFTDPFSSTLCYAHTVDDSAEATGYVVRQEKVLPAQAGIVDILPDEGEKLAAGEAVAVVYRDEAALERKNQIRQLELELEQLEYSLRRDNNSSDVAQLDQSIFAALVDLRAGVSEGNYSKLEEEAMELKNLVFRRSYTYSNNAESVEGINALVKETKQQLSTLKSAAGQDTARVRVSEPGIYSGQVDGLESVLTPEALLEMNPSQLLGVKAQPVPEGAGQMGQLITHSRWYFGAVLPEAQAARLTEGRQILVRFFRDFTGEVSMLVERIGAPENGKVAVVFSSTRFLSQITLLRKQTVELIFDSQTGIRVPKTALRVEERTLTDPETKAETKIQQSGVYAVVGMQAEWKPVSILAEEEDFFLVAPAPFQNDQNVNETKRALRAGDEIIVTAEDLYDGKVVK